MFAETGSITVGVLRKERTTITQSEPAVWMFYNEDDSTYLAARPSACWTDEFGVEWLEAVTTKRNRVLTACWKEGVQEWCIQTIKDAE